MTLPRTQFFERLLQSEVLSSSELELFQRRLGIDGAQPETGQIIEGLVAANKLTSFQASEILAGRHGTLVLGDYLLLDKIGAGGMGQVFKARHRRLKRLVALKVLPTSLTSDDESIRRFEREMEVVARLCHPNIITAHDAGQQKGIHYLVMEYIVGEDLANLVQRQGPLPLDAAISYLAQAAEGLAYAHSQGVIHRDVKPANLFVNAQGAVKILDMGLAYCETAAREGSVTHLTHGGCVMGTVDFMSPEQALDTKCADARSDIYSLGCTLFYLLTARHLYDGETLMRRLIAHREEAIPSLEAHRADLSEYLVGIFKRMVAKRPADRFADMNEVNLALTEVRHSLVCQHKSPESALPGTPELLVAPFSVEAAQAKQQEWASYLDEKVIVSNCVGGELMLIPPGEFEMGASRAEIERLLREIWGLEADRTGPEHPRYAVQITRPFRLGLFEVTQSEFQSVLRRNPSLFRDPRASAEPAGDAARRFPVERVNWFDAVEFCNELSLREHLAPWYDLRDVVRDRDGGIVSASVAEKGGPGYRLPTEAEWEYACRGGSASLGGRTVERVGGERIQLDDFTSTRFQNTMAPRTATVGSYDANALGLYDMHGNVWEWCNDWHQQPPLTWGSAGSTVNLVEVGSARHRVLRGGSWNLAAHFARMAFRGKLTPNLRFQFVGFRLAKSL